MVALFLSAVEYRKQGIVERHAVSIGFQAHGGMSETSSMRSALSQSDVSEALEGSICPMAWFDQCPETPDAPIPVSDRTCCGTKPAKSCAAR